MVGIDDPDDEASYLPDLEAAGYELRVRESQDRCLHGRRGGHPPGYPSRDTFDHLGSRISKEVRTA
ncbi:hypothetical protein [Saccharopolyspora spinosa]|uniref:hypothetical protein n=1 Tax=Saccharopolyspora spinosa TaxID=60894 RepID=UPI000319403A|nr:hypothetical protein [Saccharopolyspora spinosa]